MSTLNMKNFPFHQRNYRFFAFLATCIVCCLAFLSACEKQVDYFEYVSELRSNILLGEQDGFCIRVYAVEKENPYAADGLKRDINKRTEIYLTAPSGEKEYFIALTVDGTLYRGDAVYDNVKSEYYFSCQADVSKLCVLPICVEFGDTKVELNTQSVKTENVLTPTAALKKLCDEHGETFSSLTDKYGFAGEIYIRLIYEDAAYYYFGIIEKSGKITAFLMNAESGKILAKRES